MPHDPYRALYLHIPFCVKRCNYCDFTTSAVPVGSPEIDQYVEDLCLQVRRKAKEGELSCVQTVYLGGGTPSYIGSNRLSMLLYTLGLSMRVEPDVEVSMEANPESLNARMVRDIWALGVNRLSIGVQSFNDHELRLLGRAHDAISAQHAIEVARERFDNVSVDLMCGLPGQSADSFAQSVQLAVEAGVTHISVYPLSIEPHTPFYNMVMAEEIEQPSDDVEADHMKLAARILNDAGFHRYEVASYALPGYECKHNIAYWTGVPYLGLGTSAATMTQNAQRRMRVQDGVVTDDLSPAEMAAEDAMLGMRMSRGLSDAQVGKWSALLPDLLSCLERLEKIGLVTHLDGSWMPTERGWLCGNELYGALYDLV